MKAQLWGGSREPRRPSSGWRQFNKIQRPPRGPAAGQGARPTARFRRKLLDRHSGAVVAQRRFSSTRLILRASAVVVVLFLFAGCGRNMSGAHGKRVIVLGVDGMDPRFVEAHWNELPNLRRLRQSGGLERLATTTPPQSPVAWSSFITGMDPAQDGIFDFVHRDPATLQPL